MNKSEHDKYWTELIQTCRASGLSDYEWCRIKRTCGFICRWTHCESICCNGKKEFSVSRYSKLNFWHLSYETGCITVWRMKCWSWAAARTTWRCQPQSVNWKRLKWCDWPIINIDWIMQSMLHRKRYWKLLESIRLWSSIMQKRSAWSWERRNKMARGRKTGTTA